MTKATCPIHGEPSITEIIAALASGAQIHCDDNGYELRHPGKAIGSHTLQFHLIREGWIESTANCGGYVLSTAGRLAYMRSTDDLGNGKLVPPAPGVGEAGHQTFSRQVLMPGKDPAA